jgi:3-deoxy-D-manno-octulosonic-acid transferase
MNSIFYALFYNVIFLPAFYLALFLISLFNAKVRKGFWSRFGLSRQLKPFLKQKSNHPVMVLHCASMGEFEHTKPFLVEFKKERPEYQIMVLFFSPSGYENVKSFPVVDHFMYSPHECIVSLWSFMNKVKPSLWIVAKHDVWPNQVWFCRLFHVPLFLINASLHEQSSRLFWLMRPFNRSVYKHFTRILAVSSADRYNFSRLVNNGICQVVGDTKYDQVIYRRDESRHKQIMPPDIYNGRWVMVAGSTWPEDHFHLIPAMKKLLEENEKAMFVICPHEPTTAHLEELRIHLGEVRAALLSGLDHYRNEKIIIIDRIGVLANLYGIGKVAYVGGSFKQNIHNVLEAAVYKIPVLFGPVNQNSHESQLLKAGKGGWEVHNALEIQHVVEKFMINDVYRQESGWQAFKVVQDHGGATVKTIRNILSVVNHVPDLHPDS